MKTLVTAILLFISHLGYAQTGVLLIKVNADCSLVIDGEEEVNFEGVHTQKFSLIPGTHLVEAKSGSDAKEKIVEIEEGKQTLLILKFDITPDFTNSKVEPASRRPLDSNNLYTFGSGKSGLQGRGVLKLGEPAYSAQEEGVLEFKFRVEPDGSVSYATTTGPTTKLALKAAGIEAIKKWKFAPLEDVPAQWITVLITFRKKKD